MHYRCVSFTDKVRQGLKTNKQTKKTYYKIQKKWQNFYFLNLAVNFQNQAQLNNEKDFENNNKYLITACYLFWVARDKLTF